MSIVIKVPSLPHGANVAHVNHWYCEVHQVVARGELLAELVIKGDIIPIKAPQAGILERIFISAGESAEIGAELAYLRTGLPDLVWNEEEDTLCWNIYSAGRDESKEYELRQLIRAQEGKLGKGFGNGLALPQLENKSPEAGMGYGEAYQNQFKSHPAFKNSQQMSGDFKDPRVTTIPSNEAARKAPQNAPNLAPTPNLTLSPPTLRR
jgi:pyruvate/2-oxoglutarate dehydrogenase complex dihydrolipoamide acyltransferase (E2) component